MPIEPIVLDNLIPESYQQELIAAMTHQVSWQYEPATSMGSLEGGNFIQGHDVFQDANTIDCPQFTHYAMLNGQQTNIFQGIRPMIYFAEKRLGWTITKVGRIKLNCTTRNGPNFTSNNYNIPHIDSPLDNLFTLLYYVNDSDGDTFMFNEVHKEGHRVNSLSLNQRVTPKQGRAVVFDSNRFHAGSNPIINSSRFVINITFQPDNQ